jgi:hypothetical protein
VLVNEEETFQSETVSIKNRYAVNMVDLGGTLGRPKNRKTPGLEVSTGITKACK